MRGRFIACLCLLGAGLALAPRALFAGDTFVRLLGSIEVEGGGRLPFYGGVGPGDSTPTKFRFADLDRDGDQDLFILERDGRIVSFENDGEFRAGDEDLLGILFPGSDGWFLFADINSDGAVDLFAGPAPDGGGVAFFENVGGSGPARFEWREQSAFLDQLQEIPQFGNVPAFGDLDGDGDLDFLYIEPSNGVAAFHENIGTPTEPLFSSQLLGYCGLDTFVPTAPGGTTRHGTSVPALFDCDSDGDLDVFIGDQNNTNLWYFRNDGGPDSAICVEVTEAALEPFPTSLDRYTLWPNFADLDGDGATELYVAPAEELAELTNSVFTYRLAAACSLEYDGDQLLSGIDIGSRSVPVFGDLDDDGDFDMILGRSSIAGQEGLVYFENTGSASEPGFRLVEKGSPVSGVTHPQLDSPSPALADMDGDGDLDLLLGQGGFLGQVYYFENLGSPSAARFEYVGVLLDPDIRRRPAFLATPTLGDLDEDGDLDLLAGEYGQTGKPQIYWYRNLGEFTQAAPGSLPRFEWVTSNFDSAFGFDTLADSVSGYLAPLLVDSNCDGSDDLWIGSEDGRLRGYRREKGEERFTLVQARFEGIDVGVASAPAFVDIDADGDLDLFVGEQDGGLNYYRNDSGALEVASVGETIVVSWRQAAFGTGAIALMRSVGDAPFETVWEGSVEEGPAFEVVDDDVFPGNAYRYRPAGTSLGFSCGSTSASGIELPLPPLEVTETSASPEAGGTRVRWTPSILFRGLAFRLSRRVEGGGEFEAVAGAEELPAAAQMSVLDAGVAGGATYRIEALYRARGVTTPMPQTLFAPTLVFPALPFRIHPPRPNPASGVVRFLLDLPEQATVRLDIYDATGRIVRSLPPRSLERGLERELVWDGRDGDGEEMPGGAYFYRVRAAESEQTGRLIRMR